MYNRKNTFKPKGVKLRQFTIMLLIVSIVFVAMIIYSIVRVRRVHYEIVSTNENYVTLQRRVNELEVASELLTESVRGFVTTGERKYLDQYFEERDVTRRREPAVILLRDSPYEQSRQHIEIASSNSQNLEATEIYAMALFIVSESGNLGDYPEAIQAVELAEEDRTISAMRQKAKAQAIVYTTEYNDARKRIQYETEICKETLVQEVLSVQAQREAFLDRLLWFQTSLIALVFFLIFCIFFIVWYLILIPMQVLQENIRNQSTLPMNGAYELQFISATYNNVFEDNQQIRERLDFEASHDSLTGLNNRRRFDVSRAISKDLTIIIIDVDAFKNFNDTYGHDVGDSVLQKVSEALRTFFREDSEIYRIGGDEFAIIMREMNSQKRDILEDRFRKMQALLHRTVDGLPAISVSIGVALSDRPGASNNPLKDADLALYHVKENGRNGFAFYGD